MESYRMNNIEFIYLADAQENRIALKFRHLFTFDHQKYVAASPISEDENYVLLKSVNDKKGNPELKDIEDDEEFSQADQYYRDNYLR